MNKEIFFLEEFNEINGVGWSMAKCTVCGEKVGFFSDKLKCKQCGAWLCKDHKYMAIQSNRCPACGKHNPA